MLIEKYEIFIIILFSYNNYKNMRTHCKNKNKNLCAVYLVQSNVKKENFQYLKNHIVNF